MSRRLGSMALVPPAVVDPRRPSPSGEGVAALDPQLDTPVGLLHRRMVPPIGSSSPVPPSPSSFSSLGKVPPYVSPLAKPIPSSYSSALPTLRSWPWDDPDALPPSSSYFSDGSEKNSSQAVAEAAASDVLNDSLESLHLGPPAFVGSTSAPLPAYHHHHNRLQSSLPSYDQSLRDPSSIIFPNEGNTLLSPRSQHRESAPKSRSILLKNIPPGVDDETLRAFLANFGQLRDLGAQQRVRGGRGSVVATFFDLRHAIDAVSQLDGSIHFGRRLDVRFHTQVHPLPRSPHNGSDSSDASSPRLAPRRGASFQRAISPRASPMKSTLPSPANQGTLVVFNLDTNTTAEEIRALFGSIGAVKEIRSTPNKRHHKFVEFFDVRDAERALLTLNKTEVGGKKIKIEISRPGGRGSNSSRNQSNPPQHFRSARTSPSIPTPVGAPHRHPQLQTQAFSPLESSSLSPYSTYPPFSSDISRSMPSLSMPHQGNLDVGNTTGESPSPGFYNNQRRQYSSPYSSFDMSETVGSTDHVQFEPLGNCSPRDGLFDNPAAPTAQNGWLNYPAVYSSPEGTRRLLPDDIGATSVPSKADAHHRQSALEQFLNEGNTSSNHGLENPNIFKLPEYSPKFPGKIPKDNAQIGHHGFSRELEFGNGAPRRYDGYPAGSNGEGADRSGGSTSASPSSYKATSVENMNNGAPARKHLYSTVLRMNGHDAAARRAAVASRAQSTTKTATHSSTHQNGSNQGNSKNRLNIDKVIAGEDTRTAIMIRNIPNKYNQRMLLSALEENHRGHFDFFYLPIDFKNKCNVGYAFINFKDVKYIPAFYEEFHDHKWGRFNSEKVCEICYARIQTKSALIAHFQNSSLMNEDPKCRPVVFDAEGTQIAFPVGNPRQRRGPSARDSNRLHEHSTGSFSAMTSKVRGRCH